MASRSPDEIRYIREVGERLRLYREDRVNKAVSEIARELMITRQSIYQYEAGDHSPPINFLRRFCAMYGSDLMWLMTGETSMQMAKRVLK